MGLQESSPGICPWLEGLGRSCWEGSIPWKVMGLSKAPMQAEGFSSCFLIPELLKLLRTNSPFTITSFSPRGFCHEKANPRLG